MSEVTITGPALVVGALWASFFGVGFAGAYTLLRFLVVRPRQRHGLTPLQNEIITHWLDSWKVQHCATRTDEAEYLAKCDEGRAELVKRFEEINRMTVWR